MEPHQVAPRALIHQYLQLHETVQRHGAELAAQRERLKQLEAQAVEKWQDHRKILAVDTEAPEDVVRYGSAGWLQVQHRKRVQSLTSERLRLGVEGFLTQRCPDWDLEAREAFTDDLVCHVINSLECTVRTELQRRYFSGGVKRQRLVEHEVASRECRAQEVQRVVRVGQRYLMELHRWEFHRAQHYLEELVQEDHRPKETFMQLYTAFPHPQGWQRLGQWWSESQPQSTGKAAHAADGTTPHQTTSRDTLYVLDAQELRRKRRKVAFNAQAKEGQDAPAAVADGTDDGPAVPRLQTSAV